MFLNNLVTKGTFNNFSRFATTVNIVDNNNPEAIMAMGFLLPRFKH